MCNDSPIIAIGDFSKSHRADNTSSDWMVHTSSVYTAYPTSRGAYPTVTPHRRERHIPQYDASYHGYTKRMQLHGTTCMAHAYACEAFPTHQWSPSFFTIMYVF